MLELLPDQGLVSDDAYLWLTDHTTRLLEYTDELHRGAAHADPQPSSPAASLHASGGTRRGAVLFAPIRSNLRGCGVGSGVAGEQLLRGAGRLVAVGDAAAAAQAVGEAGEEALPCGVVIQGVGQGARPLPHRARGLDTAVVRVRPHAEQQDPVLDQQREQFGVDLAAAPPVLAAPRLDKVAVRLPQVSICHWARGRTGGTLVTRIVQSASARRAALTTLACLAASARSWCRHPSATSCGTRTASRRTGMPTVVGCSVR